MFQGPIWVLPSPGPSLHVHKFLHTLTHSLQCALQVVSGREAEGQGSLLGAGLHAHTSTMALSVERGGRAGGAPVCHFGSSQQSLAKCKMAFLAQHKDLVKNQ